MRRMNTDRKKKIYSKIAANMEIKKSIYSRAHRTLKPLGSYVAFPDVNLFTEEYVEAIPLLQDELILGLYENGFSGGEENILFTTVRLFQFKDGFWQFINYSDIVDVRQDESQQKLELSKLRVFLFDGSSVKLVVNGHGSLPKYRDAWQVLRFFRHIIDAHKKYQEK